jgi:DNA mismatch repair ATPase MutL
MPIFSGLAPEHMRIWGDNSGTTVRVDTLFGNFPVRLKAQENLREGNSEREWEELRKVVAGLLMVGGEKVALTVRDVNGSGDGAVKIMVRPKAERSGRRAWEVDVLRQLFGVGEIGGFEDWEWVRARRGRVGIEGWISKAGCASKRYQFLCEHLL